MAILQAEVRMGLGWAVVLVHGAWADDPVSVTPVAEADGTVHTDVTLAVPVDRVRAALADPIATARFSPDITSITYLSRGECPTLRVETGNAAVPVTYDYRRCATANGWKETLVSSTGLSLYEVSWNLQPVDGGTRVSYDVKVETTFPAPRFLVLRSLKSSVTTVLTGLAHAVGLD